MPWNSYFNFGQDEEEDNPFAPRQQQVGTTGVDWGFGQKENPYSGVDLSRFDKYSFTPDMIRPQRRQAPEYNMGPMERYAEYLGSEPDKADYKPGKWGTVLNALSAGMESHDKGLGAGIKLYDQLRDRPYEEEYKRWATRGNKVKADVDIENARYKNVEGAFARTRDDERADKTLEIAQAKLELDRQRAKDNGWVFKDGPDGKQVATRIRNGEQEMMTTIIPNGDETAAEKRERLAAEALATQQRYEGTSGNAKLAARTATANSIRSADTTRGAYGYKFGSGNDAIDPKLPGSTNTPAKLLQAYGEFNDPDMISVSGGRARFTEKFLKDMEDPSRGPDGKTKAEKFFQEKAARTNVPYDRLMQRWSEFKTRINPMLLPDEE